MALVYLMLLRSMNRTDEQAFWKWFRKKMDDIRDQGENGDTT